MRLRMVRRKLEVMWRERRERSASPAASVAPLALFLLVAAFRVQAAAADAVEYRVSLGEGDRAWARRADGARGDQAQSAPVEAAIAAYRRSSAALPDALAPRWRLMRALYFLGEYTTADRARRQEIFDRGRKSGEEALAIIRRSAAAASGRNLDSASPVQLVPHVRGDRDVVATFLWAGVDWGKWALAFGKMAAVRQGAAAKIRDYSQAVVQLEPGYGEAGGYRVLGRLHHQTPSVPFLTGWASRLEATRNLRLAVRLAPANFVNRLYLAEAIHDYERERAAEAIALLEGLERDAPRDGTEIEDLRAKAEAAALLKAWGASQRR